MAVRAPRRTAESRRISPLDGARERLTQEIAALEGTTIGFMDWALKVPEPKAGRLNFEYFPFQVELYEEGVNDKEGVVMKATQVGVSAWAMRWCLYHADTKGRTGLYVFPTLKDMHDFSSLRVKPLIEGSRYLRGRQAPDDPDNKGMRGLGLGIVVFRGSESKRGLDSVDADHIVFDEYDTLEEANIPDAEMRVSSPLSPGLIRRVGVPSIPDGGIDRLYHESDQRKWTTKCEACNEWQTPTFDENVDFKRQIRVCRKCRKPLDTKVGEWVADFPDRGVRGYKVTRLILPTANVPQLIVASKKRGPHHKQVFMNKHLGEAWAPEEGKLSQQALDAARNAGGGYTCATTMAEVVKDDGGQLRTMGVDVATTRNFNVRVSDHFTANGIEKKRALFLGEVERIEDLDILMEAFGVHMAAIDHLPEGRQARAFAERHQGQVYLVAYSDHKGGDVLSVQDELMFASIRRTELIDATFEAVRMQNNHLPLNCPEDYDDQMKANIRIVIEDEFGKKVVRYRKPDSQMDDYAQAESYDVAATELWWRRQGLDELMGDEEKPLDEMMEFERSRLRDYGDGEYHAGPGSDDYFQGPQG
jgi:hypothetical protein